MFLECFKYFVVLSICVVFHFKLFAFSVQTSTEQEGQEYYTELKIGFNVEVFQSVLLFSWNASCILLFFQYV